MPDQETIVQETPAEEWDEPLEELPPRPRRRLLGAGANGAGGNPIFLALFGVLLIACGFIGGVLVEKGQSSSTSSSAGGGAGLASRFAALRGAAGTGTSTSGASAGAGTSGGGASAAAGGGSFGRSGGATGAGVTTGQVAYISGSTLYVTNAEGNTVKVTTAPASTAVTKTVKADVKGIHPGETVLITGAAGSNGAISAESIRVGGTGGSGLSALFGGSGSSGGGRSGTGSTGSTSGSGPALFGNGG